MGRDLRRIYGRSYPGTTYALHDHVPSLALMQFDPKKGEREYFARIGEAGIAHSLRKPFSDEYCSFNLSSLDALFHFLAPPPAQLIEFGCGVGWLSAFLAQRGYEVTGVDISPDAIAAAKE